MVVVSTAFLASSHYRTTNEDFVDPPLSEACVRGHRATKCGHFDRWMVRVRRPGRPLPGCPHPKGVFCNCPKEKVIMMKIPIESQGQNPPTPHCGPLLELMNDQMQPGI